MGVIMEKQFKISNGKDVCGYFCANKGCRGAHVFVYDNFVEKKTK